MKFMREKDRILFGMTGIHLFSDEDFEDLESWKEGWFVNFVQNMRNWADLTLKPGKNVPDSVMCPFCFEVDQYGEVNDEGDLCSECSYGIRHGSCYGSEEYDGEGKDVYNEIIRTIHNADTHCFWRITDIRDAYYECAFGGDYESMD
jgi:hypothetical protein